MAGAGAFATGGPGVRGVNFTGTLRLSRPGSVFTMPLDWPSKTDPAARAGADSPRLASSAEQNSGTSVRMAGTITTLRVCAKRGSAHTHWCWARTLLLALFCGYSILFQQAGREPAIING